MNVVNVSLIVGDRKVLLLGNMSKQDSYSNLIYLIFIYILFVVSLY